MSKQGAASKWNGGRARYNEQMVEDERQVRDRRGNFRRVQDECTEVDYCSRRREKEGFRKGARVARRFPLTPAEL